MAGQVAANAAGTSWEQVGVRSGSGTRRVGHKRRNAPALCAPLVLVQLLYDRILGPLGMLNTFTNVTEAVATGDYAIPVATDSSGKTVPLPADINSIIYPVAPAGSVPKSMHCTAVAARRLVCACVVGPTAHPDVYPQPPCPRVGAAGVIASTAGDMSKWTRFLLAGGVTPK
jgi:CubicO group peptidase (beta-lactamase class C family)